MKTKTLLIGYFLLLTFFSCSNKNDSSRRLNSDNRVVNTKEAELVCKDSRFDFGNINMNEQKSTSTEFEFENIGVTPIVISKVDVSCGCISVNFDKNPILPNEKRKIQVVLDVRKLNGYFDKKIFVKSNAKNDVALLHVLGTVYK